jgi:hypothetical protein
MDSNNYNLIQNGNNNETFQRAFIYMLLSLKLQSNLEHYKIRNNPNLFPVSKEEMQLRKEVITETQSLYHFLNNNNHIKYDYKELIQLIQNYINNTDIRNESKRIIKSLSWHYSFLVCCMQSLNKSSIFINEYMTSLLNDFDVISNQNDIDHKPSKVINILLNIKAYINKFDDIGNKLPNLQPKLVYFTNEEHPHLRSKSLGHFAHIGEGYPTTTDLKVSVTHNPYCVNFMTKQGLIVYPQTELLPNLVYNCCQATSDDLEPAINFQFDPFNGISYSQAIIVPQSIGDSEISRNCRIDIPFKDLVPPNLLHMWKSNFNLSNNDHSVTFHINSKCFIKLTTVHNYNIEKQHGNNLTSISNDVVQSILKLEFTNSRIQPILDQLNDY